MIRPRSMKDVLPLNKIILPYSQIFPVEIELSINKSYLRIIKDEESVLTYPQYEALVNSDYGKYLIH